MTDVPAEVNGTWNIDPAHSTVGFSVKHAMVTTVRGGFTAYTGGATINADAPETSSIWAEIDATSFGTGNEQRDGHVKSAEFLDVENFPKITYRSTAMKIDGERVISTGDLTVKGVTKPVEVVWEFGGVAVDPFGNTRIGFEGEAVLSRKDFGVTWNAPLEAGGVLVSDKVKLAFDISAIKA